MNISFMHGKCYFEWNCKKSLNWVNKKYSNLNDALFLWFQIDSNLLNLSWERVQPNSSFTINFNYEDKCWDQYSNDPNDENSTNVTQIHFNRIFIFMAWSCDTQLNFSIAICVRCLKPRPDGLIKWVFYSKHEWFYL